MGTGRNREASANVIDMSQGPEADKVQKSIAALRQMGSQAMIGAEHEPAPQRVAQPERH